MRIGIPYRQELTLHSGTDPRLVLIHPPAISKRYLRTKFLPYGMSVIYAFLKEHHVPVFQYDFLMEYLFASDGDIDFHNPERSFSNRSSSRFWKAEAITRALTRSWKNTAAEFSRMRGSMLSP